MKIFWPALLFFFTACATFVQFQSLSPDERAAYIALADQMTIPQRQEYLARQSAETRQTYLAELGLVKQPEKPSPVKVESQKRATFYKGIASTTPEDRAKLMSAYDERTQACITYEDLQRGWTKEQVLLSIGKPIDIFVSEQGEKKKQLWVYHDKAPATYLYFENGQLNNWAK